MHLQTIVKALKLPADAKRAVDRLLEQPAVQEALERADQGHAERRKELREQIKAATAEAERESLSANRALDSAKRDYDAAESALHRAAEVLREATRRSLASGARARRIVDAAQRELLADSDPRVFEFLSHVSTLEGHLRLSVRNWQDVGERNVLGRREPRYYTNTDEVNAAAKLCDECRRELLSMAESAMTQREITERLADWGTRLADAVRQFDLAAPTLDADGAVTALRGPGSNAAPDVRAEAEQVAARVARGEGGHKSLVAFPPEPPPKPRTRKAGLNRGN